MKRNLMHVSRILLGVVFLCAGYNGFVVYLGFESLFPISSQAMALFNFDYLLIVEKSLEIISGLLLLFNRFVPLAISILAPIIINILLLHIFLDPSLLFLALLLFILELYLLVYYKKNFTLLFEKSPY